ncbi:Crp/Fnr family transcriptional regulator [Chitinophaga lutea]|uniref:Crp/Fnr family transcriptional regulator n=1 Tax=Chitinophaga lutea TaxID=2488634 RepID=A0A3N4PKV9_9BACT|nr:Crp/Fnr family transcriptional regulator [Chitinophaga lutea]RPE08188.1 Crp/Fnr family transcriptional regulator [Chitinophaga lutea]
MEQIRIFFQNNYTDFSEQDWLIISSKFIRQEFPKKKLILKKGEVENYVSFIEEGIVRYYIPKENKEVTFELTFSNDFIGAYDSFITRLPSVYHIETITQVTLWRVSYHDVQMLFQDTERGNLIGRLASEKLFLEKARREISLLNDTAEQRYLNLFTEQPDLIKKIPLQYIASYIGITPQALSRIRRRIS